MNNSTEFSLRGKKLRFRQRVERQLYSSSAKPAMQLLYFGGIIFGDTGRPKKNQNH